MMLPLIFAVAFMEGTRAAPSGGADDTNRSLFVSMNMGNRPYCLQNVVGDTFTEEQMSVALAEMLSSAGLELNSEGSLRSRGGRFSEVALKLFAGAESPIYLCLDVGDFAASGAGVSNELAFSSALAAHLTQRGIEYAVSLPDMHKPGNFSYWMSDGKERAAQLLKNARFLVVYVNEQIIETQIQAATYESQSSPPLHISRNERLKKPWRIEQMGH